MNRLTITHHVSVSDNDLAERYRAMGLSHPKFFKMDAMCKMGFLAATELLSQANVARDVEKPDYALVFACDSASLDTDANFESTIHCGDNYFPSPSIFVYTLPNIVMGEIAIYHRITGETTMYVAEDISSCGLVVAVGQLFEQSDVRRVICGWIEYGIHERYAMLMVVEKGQQGIEYNAKNIIKLYNDGKVDRTTQK